MKVILVKPGAFAEETDLADDLHSMQDAVGGSIQAVYPFDEKVALVCNDEGKLIGLPLNRALEGYDVIAGDFFVCGLGEEDFCSLTEEQATRYLEKFHMPQEFIQTPYGILVREYDPQAEPVQAEKATKKRSEPAR